jgi:polygalacturonase
MTLWLDGGAKLIGNADRAFYPTLPGIIKTNDEDINLGTWQGEEVTCFASLITAYDCKNVKIVGEGVIDCNALAGDWYKNHRVMRVAWRPRGIFLNRCKNVLLQGITVKDTPSWNIHPYFSKSVKLYDLKLINTPEMPTTDGIDPDTCDGVEIVGVNISVGDDCIAIKSGTIEQAKKYKLPCKNVEVRNCLMQEGHGGVVFGSEQSGGIENVKVTKCLFDGTDRGLRIKTRRGRGRIGITDNIVFENILMQNVKVPFVVNMYYNMGDETGHTEYVYTTEKLPVDDRTPLIGKFTFKNMTCTGVGYSAGAFYGLPEAPIGGVTFINVKFTYDKQSEAGYPDMKEINQKVKNQGLYFQFVDDVYLKNVKIEGQDGDEVILDGVDYFNYE